MHAPLVQYMQKFKTILRGVQGTQNFRLHLLEDTHLDLYAFISADWASCTFTHRSITTYEVFFGSNLIS